MRIMPDENVMPLLKKQENVLSFFPVFLLTCRGILYLLFNVLFPWVWGYLQSKCRPPQVPEHCSVICSDSPMPVPRTQPEVDSGTVLCHKQGDDTQVDSGTVNDRWVSQLPRTHLGEVGRWQEMGHRVILGSKPLTRFVVPMTFTYKTQTQR